MFIFPAIDLIEGLSLIHIYNMADTTTETLQDAVVEETTGAVYTEPKQTTVQPKISKTTPKTTTTTETTQPADSGQKAPVQSVQKETAPESTVCLLYTSRCV